MSSIPRVVLWWSFGAVLSGLAPVTVTACSGDAGVGGQAVSASGEEATGGRGPDSTSPANLVSSCFADLTCWYRGYYEIPDVQLRSVGGRCLLSASQPATLLNPDGTAGNGPTATDTWHVDPNGTLILCTMMDPAYCDMVCRTDDLIRFPCTGEIDLNCSDLPIDSCEALHGCGLASGACSGTPLRCPLLWDQNACRAQGCVWAP